ncbi:MAG TPA: hypothetical protein VM619_06325 [Luteimonas sp.]|nr:hypothetical protein [Luteimonas sp.]
MTTSLRARTVRRAALLSVLLVALVPMCAFAQATRTWVSGVGDDANPCSRTAPCKTFAGAISKTATGGEISVLDPGGFGAVTITKSITINNSNSGEAGILASGTNGIIINAANARVTLRGLVIDGAGTGIDGIRVLAASEVNVEDCLIQGFRGANPSRGIYAAPSTGTMRLSVRNTAIIANSQSAANNAGVLLKPSGSATVMADFANVNLANNGYGLIADGNVTSGAVLVSVRDSQLTGNHFDAARADSDGGEVALVMKNNTVTGNGYSSGLAAAVRSDGAMATVRLQDNAITSNNYGVLFTTGGKIYTYGGNLTGGNTTNGAFTSAQPTQ